MIYIDAAASALKPDAVIRAEVDFLNNHYANAGRGVCVRAAAVDLMVDNSRAKVAAFVGAAGPDNIIFTSGTTDGMNRIARMLANDTLTRGSVVIVSDLDHHSARLPFEELARRKRCKIWVCPLTDKYDMDAVALQERCAAGDVAAVVISAMSNVLGMPADVKKLVRATKTRGSKPVTIIDAAQYAAHGKIKAADWGADALVFSGHKIGADTGIGVLYLKNPDKWRPSDFGGGMVARVMPDTYTLAPGPARFEGGTLPLTQIVGLGAAVDALFQKNQTQKLADYLYDALSSNPRIHPITSKGASFVSFVVDGMHPLDFGAMMGARGVCLRVGNMCATWIHRALGITGSVRLSPGPWNTMVEIKEAVSVINRILARGE